MKHGRFMETAGIEPAKGNDRSPAVCRENA